MSETEKEEVRQLAEIYKSLPPYLRGKIDGYAEAYKDKDKEPEAEVKGA